MADLPTVFSESAATRIGAATRWAELQQGIPQDGYGSSPGNGLCLVRTRTTLPAGYTGAMAALGDVIEKQPDGTVNTLGQVWIKDQNGGTLSANTIYQARVGGTYTQNITTNGITAYTTLGLYLVQASAASTASGWQLYEYRGGSASFSNLALFNLENGATSLLMGNPLGIDAQGLPTMFGLTPRIWAKPVGGLLQLYDVTPFSFWAKSASMVDDGFGNDIVYLNSPFLGQIGILRAKDPTKAFRANYNRYGVLPMVVVNWSPMAYPFGTPANQFPYVITAAEVLQTTGGIGSGIGSGISGV